MKQAVVIYRSSRLSSKVRMTTLSCHATFWQSKEVIADNIESYLRSLAEWNPDMSVQQAWFQLRTCLFFFRVGGCISLGEFRLIMRDFLNSWIEIAWFLGVGFPPLLVETVEATLHLSNIAREQGTSNSFLATTIRTIDVPVLCLIVGGIILDW